MEHVIYKTTNLVNGKYYIGKHSTTNIDDNYLGSGTLLKRAIEKYGTSSFSKEVLHFLDSVEEAYLKEAEVITQEIVDDPNSYNMMLGGEGGFATKSFLGRKHTGETKAKIRAARMKQADPRLGKIHSEESKQKIRDKRKLQVISEESNKKRSETLKGFVHSPERNAKISEALRGKERSIEHRENLSKAAKASKKIQCPHCSKLADVRNAARWHFDNCKEIK